MLALACTLLLAFDDGYDGDSDVPEIDLGRSLEAMTRLQLQREYERVDEARPGIAGPIAVMSVGAVISAIGLTGILFAAGNFGGVGSAFNERNPTGYLLAAVIAVGAVFFASGFAAFWNRRELRAVLGDRLDAIRARLQRVDAAEPAPRPAPGPGGPVAPQL